MWQADYQPFGEVSESVTIFVNNLRFAGQYFLYQSRNVGDLSTGYDALDKLTTATVPLDSYAYAYDRNANRLTDTFNGTSTAYFLDAC